MTMCLSLFPSVCVCVRCSGVVGAGCSNVYSSSTNDLCVCWSSQCVCLAGYVMDVCLSLCVSVLDRVVLWSVQNAAMSTALPPMISVSIGPPNVFVQLVMLWLCVCHCVCVLDAVLSVQVAATFTALLLIIYVSVVALNVSVQLAMSWQCVFHCACVLDRVVLSSVQNVAMFTALLPIICVSVGPLIVAVQLVMSRPVSVVVSVCVSVLDAVVLSVQDAEIFTGLLPIFSVSVQLVMSWPCVCHCVSVYVCVLDGVVMSVQDSAMFTALLPMLCLSVSPLNMSVQLVMSWPGVCHSVCVLERVVMSLVHNA